MRVTTQGQVMIPLKIREKLGITPASEVDFVEGEDGLVYLVKVKEAKPTINRFARLRGVATVKMTTEAIMALTRGGKG